MTRLDPLEDLALVADGIAAMDTVERALREGEGDISRDFPLVRENFAVIGAELRDTLRAIALGSSVVTHLALTLLHSGAHADDDRFHACVEAHKPYVPNLKEQLDRLSGNSETVWAHVQAIESKLPSPWERLAGFLAFRSKVSESDIATALADICEGRQALYNSVYGLPRIVVEAVTSIGAGRSAAPDDRQELVLRYGKAFGDTQTRASFTALKLEDVVARLR